MAQTSFALMTNVGRAKEAAALANATTIEITHIAIGDGVTVPSGGETQLYHELARKTISGHGTVSGAANVAYFDCYLTAGEGPYTIREAGLYDVEGDLIAIAHYDPPINKPVPESGQTVEGTVRLEVAFSRRKYHNRRGPDDAGCPSAADTAAVDPNHVDVDGDAAGVTGNRRHLFDRAVANRRVGRKRRQDC